MSITTIAVESIRIDGDTQARSKLNDEAVDDYATALRDAGSRWPFPALVVFHDGSHYWLAGGFHRLLAAKRVERQTVPCTVKKGTARDARIYGMTDNDQNGQRMSREDRRRNVLWLIEQGGMSQEKMAEAAGVTARTVWNIVASLKLKTPEQQPTRKFRVDDRSPDDGDEQGTDPAFSDLFEDVESEEEPEPTKKSAPTAPKRDDFSLQRSKTAKTVEALLRAFDDLNSLRKRPDRHANAISRCKELLTTAKDW